MKRARLISVTMALSLLGTTSVLGAEGSSAPGGSDDVDPYQQTLAWGDCEGGEEGSEELEAAFECATATVPIDYADPSAGTTTIALKRLPATGDKQGTLFINPGGPGGSGVEMAFFFSLLASEGLKDVYDIVGFDPRGVGASDPLGCLDTASFDELLATDVDPADADSADRYAALVQAQGEACLQTNPQLAQHVTTVETAMDLDVLRALVGDETLHYFGASYGTFLGTTYAALFPDKAGRLVLDGAVDPSLSLTQAGLRQAAGFQLAFEDYVADCLTADCPLGSSMEEIEQKLADLLDAVVDEPLDTADPERPLTQALAFYGIAGPLYAQFEWPFLTSSLVEAFAGDGSELLANADVYNNRGTDGYLTNQAQANTAINCLDAPLHPEPEVTPTEEDFVAASPLFGDITYGYLEVGCMSWPIEPSVEAPDYSAPGAPPILVIGTTGDPATPFASARKLADTLESGVLLIRDGEGHTAYHQGNACIDEAVDAYLVDGVVPADGTECPAPVVGG